MLNMHLAVVPGYSVTEEVGLRTLEMPLVQSFKTFASLDLLHTADAVYAVIIDGLSRLSGFA